MVRGILSVLMIGTVVCGSAIILFITYYIHWFAIVTGFVFFLLWYCKDR